MKKFSYRMENVLKIKKQLEEQQKIDFAIAQGKLNDEKDKLIELTIRQQRYERKAKKLMQKDRLDLKAVKENRNAITTMKALVRQQMVQVHIAEKEVEKERVKLTEMQMDRKTHEKLKEYAFKDYMLEYEREESKEIDQLVSYTYTMR
ncbi:MAG: flagellar export protein FliJ [Eubacterium sp.]|nr:flagellar export protein FliJ [Eubacterium sp.]